MNFKTEHVQVSVNLFFCDDALINSYQHHFAP